MKSQTGCPRNVVWAVDAFEEKTGAPLEVAEIIGRLKKAEAGLRVLPVHVLGPTELSLSSEFPGPWVGQYLPSAEQALDRLLEELELEGVERPEILTQTSASTSGSVDCLVAYACRKDADLIVAGSHRRSGISRWLMGSFSETLISRSPIPVMVVGPRRRSELDFGRILFPTDFGPESEESFRLVVDFARTMSARVTLYHALSRFGRAAPVHGAFGAGGAGGAWVALPDHGEMRDVLARAQRHLESWARWSAHRGVETSTVIDSETIRVSESILALARELNAGWIAMASDAGPLLSVVFGSSARRVVRGAECPVWVIRPASENGRRLGWERAA